MASALVGIVAGYAARAPDALVAAIAANGFVACSLARPWWFRGLVLATAAIGLAVTLGLWPGASMDQALLLLAALGVQTVVMIVRAPGSNAWRWTAVAAWTVATLVWALGFVAYALGETAQQRNPWPWLWLAGALFAPAISIAMRWNRAMPHP